MNASNGDRDRVAERILSKLQLTNRLFCDIGPHAGQARFDVDSLFLTVTEQALLADIQRRLSESEIEPRAGLVASRRPDPAPHGGHR